jgi:hypothetical protein
MSVLALIVCHSCLVASLGFTAPRLAYLQCVIATVAAAATAVASAEIEDALSPLRPAAATTVCYYVSSAGARTRAGGIVVQRTAASCTATGHERVYERALRTQNTLHLCAFTTDEQRRSKPVCMHARHCTHSPLKPPSVLLIDDVTAALPVSMMPATMKATGDAPGTLSTPFAN